MKRTHSLTRRSQGFTLIEVIIVLAIIGSGLALVLYYQSRAEAILKANSTAQDLTLLASKLKTYYGATGGYTNATLDQLNQIGVIGGSLTASGTGASTSVVDSWGSSLTLTGGTSSFVLTLGNNQTMASEACLNIVSRMSKGAAAVDVGGTAASGVISTAGTTVMSTTASPNVAYSQANAITGCAKTSGRSLNFQFN